MTTRRDILKTLGAGAAVAATSLGASAVAHAARKDELHAFSQGGDTRTSPWWLLAPLTAGASIGMGWRVGQLSPIRKGATVLTLAHRDGREARVHICARHGRTRGVAGTALFDLMLMDGSQGATPTDEGLGRALKGVAQRIVANELSGAEEMDRNLNAVSGLLSHDDRVAIYGPEHIL